jgi:hypothetical protein
MKPRPLWGAFLVFLFWPAIAAAAELPARHDDGLKAAVAALRHCQYLETQHLAAQKSLIELRAALDTADAKSPQQQKLDAAITSAVGQESSFWQQLPPEQRTGADKIPEQPAAALLTKLQAVLDLLSAPAFRPNGSAAGPGPQGPSPKLDHQAKAIEGLAKSGATDASRSAEFWDHNQSRGGVAQPPAVSLRTLRGSNSAGSTGTSGTARPKGLVVHDIPGLKAEPAKAPLRQAAPKAPAPGLRDAVHAGAVQVVTPPVWSGALAGQSLTPRLELQPAPPAAPAPPSPCAQALSDHPSLAGHCQQWPIGAPMAAGLLDALQEQFGTVSGWLSNLGFALFGLLLSAASGLGVVAKIVTTLISLGLMSWTIWSLLKQAWNAFAALHNSRDGTAEHYSAWRAVGKVAGTLLVLVAMAVLGYKLGQTKPAQDAAAFTQAKLSGGLQKIGLSDAASAVDVKAPDFLQDLLGPQTSAAGKFARISSEASTPRGANALSAGLENGQAGKVHPKSVNGEPVQSQHYQPTAKELQAAGK